MREKELPIDLTKHGVHSFLPAYLQALLFLEVMNWYDGIVIDRLWVGHTKTWIIPGTEDLRPYITAKDKKKKWIMGTVGMAILAAALSGIMAPILK